MPHEDYVPAPTSPDYSFDPATLYQELPRGLASSQPPPTPPPPIDARLAKFGGALVLAGVIGLLVGQHRLARAHATRGWMETSAVITSAKLHASGNDYHLDLAYRYRAGPRERSGARLALEPDLSRDGAYRYAERFRPGARVPAWFDPAAPDSAVLEKPKVAAPWAPTVAGAALLVVGLLPFVRQTGRHLLHRRDLRRAAAA